MVGVRPENADNDCISVFFSSFGFDKVLDVPLHRLTNLRFYLPIRLGRSLRQAWRIPYALSNIAGPRAAPVGRFLVDGVPCQSTLNG